MEHSGPSSGWESHKDETDLVPALLELTVGLLGGSGGEDRDLQPKKAWNEKQVLLGIMVDGSAVAKNTDLDLSAPGLNSALSTSFVTMGKSLNTFDPRPFICKMWITIESSSWYVIMIQ